MVYFISNGSNIKVGIAKNVDERLKTLQTGSDKRLRLLATEICEDDYKRESELHKKFASDRIRSNGEWFLPSVELLEHINKISKYFVINSNGDITIYNKMSK